MPRLTLAQQRMLDGEEGPGTQIAMEIVTTLAKIYDAEDLVPVHSCQVSGISYANIGEAGLEFLESLRKGGARARVPAMTNPCGLDLEKWQQIGFSEEFHKKQKRVLDVYTSLGLQPSCSCTPYLLGIVPDMKAHLAWSESSAVSYANSVLGARTNREGGPAALSAALTGVTGNYGLHIEEKRVPEVLVQVEPSIKTFHEFATLGLELGAKIGSKVALISGLNPCACTNDRLKQLGAAMAATGAVALFHVEGVTPEALSNPGWTKDLRWNERIVITKLQDPDRKYRDEKKVDLVFFGCPHASENEAREILDGLRGKEVKTRTWIAMSNDLREELETREKMLGDLDPKIQLVADTCIVVCPVADLGVQSIATNSGKAWYYLKNSPGLEAYHLDTEECMDAAITGSVPSGGRHEQ